MFNSLTDALTKELAPVDNRNIKEISIDHVPKVQVWFGINIVHRSFQINAPDKCRDYPCYMFQPTISQSLG